MAGDPAANDAGEDGAGEEGGAGDVRDGAEGVAEAVIGEAAGVPVAALLAAPVMVPVLAAEHPARAQTPSAAAPARSVLTRRIVRAVTPALAGPGCRLRLLVRADD